MTALITTGIASVSGFLVGVAQFFIVSFVGGFGVGLGLGLERPLSLVGQSIDACKRVVTWPIRAFRSSQEYGRSAFTRRPAAAAAAAAAAETFRPPMPKDLYNKTTTVVEETTKVETSFDDEDPSAAKPQV